MFTKTVGAPALKRVDKQSLGNRMKGIVVLTRAVPNFGYSRPAGRSAADFRPY